MLWAPNCARLHLSAVFFSFFLDTSEKLKKKQATSASTEPLGAAIFDACIKIYLCKKKKKQSCGEPKSARLHLLTGFFVLSLRT